MGREAGGSRVLPPCHHVVVMREKRVLAGFNACWLDAGWFTLVKNGSRCETRQVLHASAEQSPGGRCHAWNGASQLATRLRLWAALSSSGLPGCSDQRQPSVWRGHHFHQHPFAAPQLVGVWGPALRIASTWFAARAR